MLARKCECAEICWFLRLTWTRWSVLHSGTGTKTTRAFLPATSISYIQHTTQASKTVGLAPTAPETEFSCAVTSYPSSTDGNTFEVGLLVQLKESLKQAAKTSTHVLFMPCPTEEAHINPEARNIPQWRQMWLGTPWLKSEERKESFTTPSIGKAWRMRWIKWLLADLLDVNRRS